MSFRMSSLAGKFAAPMLIAAALAAMPMAPYSVQRLQSLDSEWTIEPDPPTTESDLEVSYDGEETEVYYQVEGEDPVRVDVSEHSSFKIPRSELGGKHYVKLIARASEDAYRIVRFP